MRCGKNYWPAVAFTFYATFKRAINRPKSDPRLFFFSNSFINGPAFIISGKKLIIFFHCARECKGKNIQIIINPRFYFTDTRKQLWNCCNIYESAVSITSPLKTITDPNWNKNGQNRPKNGSKANFLFSRSSRYNCPTFYEKKISVL